MADKKVGSILYAFLFSSGTPDPKFAILAGMSKTKSDPETGVVITECETWDEFIAELRIGEGRYIGGHIYRGHGNADWNLASEFERWLGQMKQGRNTPQKCRFCL